MYKKQLQPKITLPYLVKRNEDAECLRLHEFKKPYIILEEESHLLNDLLLPDGHL